MSRLLYANESLPNQAGLEKRLSMGNQILASTEADSSINNIQVGNNDAMYFGGESRNN